LFSFVFPSAVHAVSLLT